MTRWMKIDGACKHLGGLSRKVVYRAVASGKLRAARIGAGRNLLFSTEWLDAYAESCAHRRHDDQAPGAEARS